MPVDCRAFGEAINLAVSNPRITEWLIAGNLSPDSFHVPFGIFNIFRAQNSTFSLLDVGHFITGEAISLPCGTTSQNGIGPGEFV